MNVLSVHIFFAPRHQPSSSATVDVPGLGEISLQGVLSNELRQAINNEVIIALRQKMGLPQFVQQTEEIKEPTLRPQYWKNDIKEPPKGPPIRMVAEDQTDFRHSHEGN